MKPIADDAASCIAHGFHRVSAARRENVAAQADVGSRTPVSAELGFGQYVEGLYEATSGAAHVA